MHNRERSSCTRNKSAAKLVAAVKGSRAVAATQNNRRNKIPRRRVANGASGVKTVCAFATKLKKATSEIELKEFLGESG